MTGLDPGKITYVHHTAGRLRIRVLSVRGNPELAAAFQRAVRRILGVRSVRACTITGSVVVQYNPAQINEKCLLGLLSVSPPSITVSTERTCTCGASSVPKASPVSRKIGSWVLGKTAEIALEYSLTLLVGALL